MPSKMTATEAAAFKGVSLQAIHKSLKTKGLPFEKKQNRAFFGHTTARGLFELSFSPQIVAFQIVKGGTGKTSLAHSIAIRASLYGAKVLCVDLDQQANLTQSLGVDAEEMPTMIDVLKKQARITDCIIKVDDGVDLIPSRIENALLDNTLMLERYPLDKVYREPFLKFKNNYDLIVIDCPPALGQSVASIALASDMIIAPVTPEKFSLSGLKISTDEIDNIQSRYQVKIPLRLILNKFDTRTSLSHEILSSLIKHPVFSEKLFKTYVRTSQDFPNAIAEGVSIFEVLKQTAAKEDIDLVTREILNLPLKKELPVSLGKLEG